MNSTDRPGHPGDPGRGERPDAGDGERPTAESVGTRAFDIRYVIAALLAIFGVIILFMGWFGTTESDLERADGTNLNLWTGAGLLVAAAVFALWSWLRPVPLEEVRSDDGHEKRSGDH